jgi:hypothetical protein
MGKKMAVFQVKFPATRCKVELFIVQCSMFSSEKRKNMALRIGESAVF